MPIGSKTLNLLCLDGGGVRGLSTLYILKRVMETVNPDFPPRPCEYFDMIAGTGSGGLIGIMLGRLNMTVDQCIDSYTKLSKQVFSSNTPQGAGIKRRDSSGARLEQALRDILNEYGYDEKTLFKSADEKCKVFTCVEEDGKTVNLASYASQHGSPGHYQSTTLLKATQVTFARVLDFAAALENPTAQALRDASIDSNNPIRRLWAEAQETWPFAPLKSQLGCILSIGTGLPSVQRFNLDIPRMARVLRTVSNESEATANLFLREYTELDDEDRYFRFNVPNGLADIGPHEVDETSTLVCATQDYIAHELVHKYIERCARSLDTRGQQRLSAWEVPGATRSQAGNEKSEPNQGPRERTGTFQSQGRPAKFLGFFGSKKTPVAV